MDRNITEYNLPDIIREIDNADMSFLSTEQLLVVDKKAVGISSFEACPGSGKTTTIKYLVHNMISNNIDPDKLLIVTFSKNGASELREKIAKILWKDISQDEVEFFKNPIGSVQYNSWADKDKARKMLVSNTCTIHALCYRILSWLGYRVTVIDSAPAALRYGADDIIKDSIARFQWEESPKSVKAWISHAIISLVDYERSCQSWFAQELIKQGGNGWQAENLEKIYRMYMRYMKKNNLIDFDMMQSRVLWIVRNNPESMNVIQGMFDYIIVDEAQDTSAEQAEILWSITKDNLLMVGDCDQSMYRFRHAVPEVLRGKLDNQFDNVSRLSLTYNRRSTQTIVNATSRLISNNYNESNMRYIKQYNCDNAIGDPIEIISGVDFNAMTDNVASVIVNDISDGGNPSDWFVLSRTRAECELIYNALIENNIPAINKSGGNMFGSGYIAKVIAYMQLAINYKDSRNNLEVLSLVANIASSEFCAPLTRRQHIDTCVSKDKAWIDCGCPVVMREGIDKSPARYIGRKTIEKAGSFEGLMRLQYDRNKGGYPSLESKGCRDMVGFITKLEKISNCKELAETIINESIKPYMMHEEGISQDDLSENGKDEDFDILIGMIGDMTTEQFLNYIEELKDKAVGQNDNESVIVATIHWSKGSERKSVIVNMTRMPIATPFVKPDTLPSPNPKNSIYDERSIAYVACTRAISRLILSYSLSWKGQEALPSMFIGEMGIDIE